MISREKLSNAAFKSLNFQNKLKNCWKNPCYSRSRTALFKELRPSKKPRYSNPRKSNPRYSRSPCRTRSRIQKCEISEIRSSGSL